MSIELLDECPCLECHGCGLRVTVHPIEFEYLCQHYVFLCDDCLSKLRRLIAAAPECPIGAIGTEPLCERAAPEVGEEQEKTRIICLCGSTRFTETMLIESWEIGKRGMIALGWHALPDSYFEDGPTDHMADKEGVREIVDEVHKRKIDLADEILVINVGGYIGDSTKSEMRYAAKRGKPIYFYEPIYADKNLREAGVKVREK